MNARQAMLGLWLSAAALSALPARAAKEASESSDSTKVFAEAVKAFKAGNAADALPKFQQLAATTKSPNAALYVGYCLMELGRQREAHRAFSLTIRYALAMNDPRYDAARDAAQEQVLALNLRLAKLVLSFVDPPPSLQVFVDDVAVTAEDLGSPIVLEPGTHHVRATADGAHPIERDESIEAGGSKTLTLSFAKDQGAPTALPAALTPRSQGSTLRMLGFVSGGVAVAGLTVFAITGMKTRSIHAQLENECPRGCSDPDHLDLVGRGKSMQAVANISLAIGAVSAVAAGSLLYFGYQKGSTAEPSIAFHRGGMTLQYRGTF